MMETVTGSTREERNRLIAEPRRLYTDDGREVWLQKWQPTIEIDNYITVKIEGFIGRKEDKENK